MIEIIPESVWAQGSSNSGVLYLIFSSSHLLIFTSSLTPSHLHIFSHTFSSSLTPSHLHIFSPTFSSSHLLSHLLIFTSSLTPSHLHIFSPTFSSSHLLSHLLIFTSSLTPSHLHIFSHTFSSSHLLSHLLIFTSSLTPFSSSHLLSHLLIFTSSLSLILSPFSLLFLSLAFFIFLSLGRGWYRRWVTKRQPFRTKWGSMVKNWGKIAILLVPEQPFARNEGRSSKTEEKLRFYLC